MFPRLTRHTGSQFEHPEFLKVAALAVHEIKGGEQALCAPRVAPSRPRQGGLLLGDQLISANLSVSFGNQ
jgi:hypothetical protein